MESPPKKKTKKKKKRTKSKDNIFASKHSYNIQSDNFPDLGYDRAQTTSSLLNTYDNYQGLYTKNSYTGAIYDTQDNPTMRTNHAVMNSVDDRFNI